MTPGGKNCCASSTSLRSQYGVKGLSTVRPNSSHLKIATTYDGFTIITFPVTTALWDSCVSSGNVHITHMTYGAIFPQAS